MSKKPPKTSKKENNKNKVSKNNLQISKKLKNKFSYYSYTEEHKSIFDLFKKIVEIHQYKGLYITRSNSEYINNTQKKIKNIILKQKNLDEILKLTKNYIKQNKKSIILLDRVDYLISNFSFNQFIKYLYRMTEIISENNSIFLLIINKTFLEEKQLTLIKNELQPIPGQNLEEIQIKADHYEILKLINKYYKNNILIEYKRISDELSINRKTLSKKINHLTKQDLIIINKSGRSKIPNLTDKAKAILNKNP
jgi:hypothetical protein